MNYLAQIFGFFGLIFLMISLQNNKKKNVLLFMILANIFYGLQYIVLGSLSAGLMNFVSLIRCIVFYVYSKDNKQIPVTILATFLTIIIIISIFTYSGIISIIPILATLLFTYGTWQDNLRLYRIITLSVMFPWMLFNYFTGAYISLISNLFELSNSLVSIYRFDVRGKNNGIKKD